MVPVLLVRRGCKTAALTAALTAQLIYDVRLRAFQVNCRASMLYALPREEGRRGGVEYEIQQIAESAIQKG